MKTFDQLEPACKNTNPKAECSEVFLFSIAISLKRIADMLSEQNEYGEGPAAAIGGAIKRGLQNS